MATLADRGENTHWRCDGRPKVAYTVQQVKQVLADRPNLVAYKCAHCGQMHVGNR